ncbi:MAG: peroxiredoxin [Meiothermus sp.]|mgnify:CR=1 FL=1
MPVRSAEAIWKGTLKEGKGHLKLQSGVYEGPYTYASRFESGPETNPEELVGAAHAGCFAMFLSALLTNNGLIPERLHAKSSVHLGEGPTITKIVLELEATVPGLSEEKFHELAQEAKAKCPISKALAAVPEIELRAKLVSGEAVSGQP